MKLKTTYPTACAALPTKTDAFIRISTDGCTQQEGLSSTEPKPAEHTFGVGAYAEYLFIPKAENYLLIMRLLPVNSDCWLHI